VHHGNGVQNAFYEDPNVLYISIHVHKNGQFYPFGPLGDHTHNGEGRGRGRNVNIPWADINMGDGDYIYAFQQVVMPIAVEFDPDLVIISAGFDAAEGDMLGGCHVTPSGYAHMTHMLMQLAEGKVAVCLEGGYNLTSIAKSALAVTKTLMGEPPERILDVSPSPLGVATTHMVMREQSQFWKCMYPKSENRVYPVTFPTARLHDIVRSWQCKVLFDTFGMSPLMIIRDKISKSFKDQVLAT
jgi:histone deacetylase 6